MIGLSLSRKLNYRSGRDLSIHTGTFGVLSYTDVNNKKVPIYLYISGETRVQYSKLMCSIIFFVDF